MKILTKPLFVILLIITVFGNSCSEEQFTISSDKNSGNKFLIYDYQKNGVGLSLVSVELSKASGNIKKDIIAAFLENNHFINSQKVSLSRMEEIGESTRFYLTSVQDLENANDLQLFNKALELTIIRHLKNDDFTIIYGQTAQL